MREILRKKQLESEHEAVYDNDYFVVKDTSNVEVDFHDGVFEESMDIMEEMIPFKNLKLVLGYIILYTIVKILFTITRWKPLNIAGIILSLGIVYGYGKVYYKQRRLCKSGKRFQSVKQI